MRALIGEWLTFEGYEAHAAVGNASVVPHADLVIVDVPNLRAGNAEPLRAVRARYPGAPLIGLSTQLGRSLSSDSSSARRLGVQQLVAKPCTRAELLQAVVEAVGPAR